MAGSCFKFDACEEDRAWLAWLAPLERAATDAGAITGVIDWRLSYTAFRSTRDGFDANELRRATAAAQARDGGGGVTLVAVRTNVVGGGGGICGVLSNFPWSAEGSGQFGNFDQCFVFSITEGAAQIWRGEDDDAYDADDSLTVGPIRFGEGGVVVGFTRQGSALQLAADLRSGSTGRSSFFGNKALCKERQFEVVEVVALRVGVASPGTGVGEGVDAEAEDETLHCLRDGPDSFLLNFISSSARGGVNQHHFS